MGHLPTLIVDLALILISASIISFIFKKLKQPVVLGYIVAGFLASPYVPFIPTVMDKSNIEIWAQMGVIFLLFALGLEFSFKKLIRVGSAAVITTTTIVIAMMSLGYLTGKTLGWSHMDSIFLGGMLCMSSTMIIIKVFDDLGLRQQNFTQLVFGILIVEDLFGVLLLVLLSTLAVSKHFEGIGMLESVVKLLAFLMFWFFIGIYIIPTLFKKAKRFLNDEALLVISLGLCLGMVLLATQAGFSAALGAFVMGSIMAETLEAERIDHIIEPIKNLFGAIFFVSVGMMLDPAVIVAYFVPVLIIICVLIVGQIVFGTVGILLSGQTLKTAIQSGFSLPQIGEFSFIIATTGLSLGVISKFLYPVIIAVSVITIFVTPFLLKLSLPVYRLAERRLPKSWHTYFDKRASGARPVNQQSTWKNLLKAIIKIVVTYLVISIMIIVLSFKYLVPFITRQIPGIWGSVICTVIILAMLSPFLRAIMIKKNHSIEFEELWNISKTNRGPLLFLIIFRTIICTALVMFVVATLLDPRFGVTLAIALSVIAIFIFSKGLKKRSILIERRFKSNLYARQFYLEQNAPIRQQFANHLLSRDLHLAEFDVKPQYIIVGKTLKELNFYQLYGVYVVTIIRENKRINIPGGDDRIFPYDKLIVLGTDKQVILFQRFIEDRKRHYQQEEERSPEVSVAVTIAQFQIEPDSLYIGKTIKDSGIRDKADCLVVGIERGEASIMNPDINTPFMEGDIVWVVGERVKIQQLSNNQRQKEYDTN